jgi:hypothetical protein
MNLSKKTGIAIFIVVIVFGALHFGGERSASVIKNIDSFIVPSAEARVGRPLTPVSVAGVARRSSRRTVRRRY